MLDRLTADGLIELGPGGSARRPAAPLLPADPGRAAGRWPRRPSSGRYRPRGAGETGPDRGGGIRISGGLDLEQRYRRVLRLLPGYYRDTWEEDMVAGLPGQLADRRPGRRRVTMEFDRPSWPEVASVAGLAARLYLGGGGAPLRSWP